MFIGAHRINERMKRAEELENQVIEVESTAGYLKSQLVESETHNEELKDN